MDSFGTSTSAPPPSGEVAPVPEVEATGPVPMEDAVPQLETTVEEGM